MKTILIITLLVFIVLAGKAQTVDTVKLKSTLSAAKEVVLARRDISVADAVPLLNGLEQLIQADYRLLMVERGKKGGKK